MESLDKLYALWDYLNKNDLIRNKRPETTEEAKDDCEFVFEKILAHKFFFPTSKLSEIKGLDGLVVWVADPNFDSLSKEMWEFTGTFLYLIQAIYDHGSFRTTISGCSSLQAISNIVNGESFYTIDGHEPLGRYNNQHPVEKLKGIGAVYLQKQEIMTVYKKRYMTDEQTFEHNGEKYRCNDLLGYPLFIC